MALKHGDLTEDLYMCYILLPDCNISYSKLDGCFTVTFSLLRRIMSPVRATRGGNCRMKNGQIFSLQGSCYNLSN